MVVVPRGAGVRGRSEGKPSPACVEGNLVVGSAIPRENLQSAPSRRDFPNVDLAQEVTAGDQRMVRTECHCRRHVGVVLIDLHRLVAVLGLPHRHVIMVQPILGPLASRHEVAAVEVKLAPRGRSTERRLGRAEQGERWRIFWTIPVTTASPPSDWTRAWLSWGDSVLRSRPFVADQNRNAEFWSLVKRNGKRIGNPRYCKARRRADSMQGTSSRPVPDDDLTIATGGGEVSPVGRKCHMPRPFLRMAGQCLGDPAEILELVDANRAFLTDVGDPDDQLSPIGRECEGFGLTDGRHAILAPERGAELSGRQLPDPDRLVDPSCGQVSAVGAEVQGE